jgi:hypothetical protein
VLGVHHPREFGPKEIGLITRCELLLWFHLPL